MRNAHNKLLRKSRAYARWHEHPRHAPVHWWIVAVVALASVSSVFASWSVSVRELRILATQQTVSAKTIPVCTGSANECTDTYDPNSQYISKPYSYTVTRNVPYNDPPEPCNNPVPSTPAYFSSERCMDIYEPTGDNNPKRPLLILVHGGGFVGGDKAVTAEASPQLAVSFARRGYVTASINYRLNSCINGQCRIDGRSCQTNSPDCRPVRGTTKGQTVVFMAQHDADAAIRYFIKNSAVYGVDTTKIAVSGTSAGAVASLMSGYHYEHDQEPPGTIPNNSHCTPVLCPAQNPLIQASIPLSGESEKNMMKLNDPPALIFHDKQDLVTLYDATGFPCPNNNCAGAVQVAQEAASKQIPYEFHTYNSKLHGSQIYNDNPAFVEFEIADFLCRHLNLPCAKSSPPPPPAPGAIPTTPPGRYLNEVFPNFKKTADIPYSRAVNADGQNQTLKFDLYEPLGDTAQNRPVLLLMHGGGFTTGDKNDPLFINPIAPSFARRGFVTISMSYRLRPNLQDPAPDQGQWNDAQDDAHAAIRWLHCSAESADPKSDCFTETQSLNPFEGPNGATLLNPYKIHPDYIVLGGWSAGALASLTSGYDYERMNQPTSPSGNPNLSNLGFESIPLAVVSYAGSMTAAFMQSNDPPLQLHHGTEDTKVAYANAARIANRASGISLPYDFQTYLGGPHNLVQFDKNRVISSTSRFIYQQLLSGTPLACPNNQQIGAGEECDGANVNNRTCQSFNPSFSFKGAAVRCSTSCTFDLGECVLGSGAPLVVFITATDAQAQETPVGVPLDTGSMTIQRTGDLTNQLFVLVSFAGTAVRGTDYQSISFDTVLMGPGVSSVNIPITPIDDSAAEGAETAVVSVVAAAGYTVGSPSSATVTIADNDTVLSGIPTVTVFTLRARATDNPVTFDYAVAWNGKSPLSRVELWRAPFSATGCNDTVKTGCQWGSAPVAVNFISASEFDASSGSLTDTPADGTWWYGLHAVDQAGNVGFEPNPPGPLQAVKTPAPIVLPDYTIDKFVVTHGATVCIGDAIDIDTTVLNSGAAAAGTASNAAVSDNGQQACADTTPALSPGATKSYTCAPTMNTPGTHTLISIADVNNAVPESNEGNNTSTYTLTVTDCGSPLSPVITITATDAQAAETTAAETANPGQFTLQRTGDVTNQLLINVSFAGTAVKGVDYQSLTVFTVLMSPGVPSVSFPVTPIDDSSAETAETVIVSVASGIGYTIGTPSVATVTIDDNDVPPPLLKSPNLDCDAAPNVDVFDLALLMYFWGTPSPHTTACGADADLNGDSAVNVGDLGRISDCWGSPTSCP